MKLKIIIDSDNAALTQPGWAREIARILEVIGGHVKEEADDCPAVEEPCEINTLYRTIHDINGNDVGRWRLTGLHYHGD